MKPADGERAALIGFGGQFGIAARIVLSRLRSIDWIRVADPAAGIADDFQFRSAGVQHALQVKWSEHPSSFTWSDLVGSSNGEDSLLAGLAKAWAGLDRTADSALEIHLCSNNYPSTRNGPNTVLEECSKSGAKHFAGFLAQSYLEVRRQLASDPLSWEDLTKSDLVTAWLPAWEDLREKSTLEPDDFVRFVRDLDIQLGMNDSPAAGNLVVGADRDVAEMSMALQNIVRDRRRPTELTREQLLDRLDWSSRLTYRSRHAFPVPSLYQANAQALSDLTERIATLSGGYLALIGPAGSGKSTLLAKFEIPKAVIVRYFAFVPDAADPLSVRGESSSFLHDLALALDEAGLPRVGIGQDQQSQREAITRQFDDANQRWTNQGLRTIVVIDGLDHVGREQRPQRSFVEDLFGPGEIPEGVFVVLGTQTAAILPSTVARTLAADGRTITMSPLTVDEVGRLVDSSGVGEWLVPQQRMRLLEATEGHPLATTYLLEDLKAMAARESDTDARYEHADRIVAAGVGFGASVTQRYDGYYEAIRNDAELENLTGVVSRLRGAMDLAWIASWAQPAAFKRFEALTEPLCRREGDRWSFIHNSFRLFLVGRTSAGSEQRDVAFHTQLADLCAVARDEWPEYGGEEAAQRYLAGDDAAVLQLVTPDALRQALETLEPAASVTQRLFVGLRAAARADDRIAVIRLLLFHNELWQRGYTLAPEALAKHLASTKRSMVERHVVSGRALALDVPVAMEIAATQIANGEASTAGVINKVVGGLAGIIERSRNFNRGDFSDAVADWAEVSFVLSGVEATLEEIAAHLPLPNSLPVPSGEDWRARKERAARVSARCSALARCTDTARTELDDLALARLQDVIDNDGISFWMARCRFVRALRCRDRRDDVGMLEALYEIVGLVEAAASSQATEDEEGERDLPQWLLLQCGELLLVAGLEDADLVDDFLTAAGPVHWPDSIATDKGLDPYSSWRASRRIKLMRGDHLVEIPGGTDHDFGQVRLQRAIDDLARLEVRARRATGASFRGDVPDVGVDRIVRVLEVSATAMRSMRSSYVVISAATDLWSRAVAAIAECEGPTGVSAVLQKFTDAWDDDDRSEYWPARRRLSVLSAVAEHGDSQLVHDVQRMLEPLVDAVVAEATDAHDRVELLMEMSTLWHSVDHSERASELTRLAVRSAFSVGTHDDDQQLAVWFEWTVKALRSEELSVEDFYEISNEFLRRLVAVEFPSHVEAEAADLLIREVWTVSPRGAVDAAELLVDAGVVGEIDGVDAVVSAAAADPRVSLEFVSHIAAALLIPMAESTLATFTAAVSQRSEDSDASTAISRIDRAFATWSMETVMVPTPPDPEGRSAATVSAHELLERLRASSRTDPDLPDSQSFRAAAEGRRSLQTAKSLLAESQRLDLDVESIGFCAAMVADEGEGSVAIDALRPVLDALHPRDWSRSWAGGKRLKLLASASHSGNEQLRAFAWNDLATCVASQALTGIIHAREFLELVVTFADPCVLVDVLPDIRSSLDCYAPVAPSDGLGQLVESDPESVLCEWLTRGFGHPSRDLDFGARRSMVAALRLGGGDPQLHLAQAIQSGGWSAEAALDCVLRVLVDSEFDLIPSVIEAVEETARSEDAILRDLAASILHATGSSVLGASHRSLPAAYRLVMPSVPDRKAPELDRNGVPFIDGSNPQQVVAPFDLAIGVVAEIAGLDVDAVLHRAASLRARCADRWTSGGHKAFAERVHRRKQKLVYRPWAFMIGRRALGVVLADLHDAGLVPDTQTPAFSLGLIDRTLIDIEPLPLDPTTAEPFRRADAEEYSAEDWEDEVELSASQAASALPSGRGFVLAERSRWRLQIDDCPREQRVVTAVHGSAGSLMPGYRSMGGWERTDLPAEWYLTDSAFDWEGGELVVSGIEMSTDPTHLRWLALHPEVGRLLGWVPSRPMSWVGADGQPRAWTEVRVRGQIELTSRSGGSTAEVWRVMLSETGKAEVEDRFGQLSRRLVVIRDRPIKGTPDSWSDGSSGSVVLP